MTSMFPTQIIQFEVIPLANYWRYLHSNQLLICLKLLTFSFFLMTDYEVFLGGIVFFVQNPTGLNLCTLKFNFLTQVLTH